MICRNLLEPLQETFGRLAIRSAYRSAQVNAFGNAIIRIAPQTRQIELAIVGISAAQMEEWGA